MANEEIVGSSNASQQGLAPFQPGEEIRVSDARLAAAYGGRPAGRSDTEYAADCAARGLCVLCTRAEYVTGQFARCQNEARDRGIPVLVLTRDAIDEARDAAMPKWTKAGDADKAAAVAVARGGKQ